MAGKKTSGGGFVKVWRKMLDSAVMEDDWLCRLWMWCLLNAKWYGDTRGQFVTSRSIASDNLKVTGSKWYRGIVRLRQLGCIEIETEKSNSNRTRITVCKYTTYQDLNGDGEHQTNSERTANEQAANNQLIIDEEEEEVKKSKNVTTTPKRFVKPTLQEVMNYVTERGRRIDPEAFYAYYEANGWKVGKNQMKNWHAAVRHWEANEKKRLVEPIKAKPLTTEQIASGRYSSTTGWTPRD